MTCADAVKYEEDLPSDLTAISIYTRADFVNLAPWVGPPIVWGQGSGFGVEILHDPPPYFHNCTLARDFLTNWPGSIDEGSDPLVVGVCDAMIPLVCAYCWGRSWRRCDSVPRVGKFGQFEAHMSPVLVLCDTCGLTSDYNIARFIVLNRFDSVTALLERGQAGIMDIFRNVLAISQWRDDGAPYCFSTSVCDSSKAHYVRLMNLVRTALQDALDRVSPSMAQCTDVTSIVMEYWQGISMTPADPRELTAIMPAFLGTAIYCTHAFPCVPGTKCIWADKWTYEWGNEVTNTHIHLNAKFRDHADDWFPGVVNWKPNSWAQWRAIRAHRCILDNMLDSDWDGVSQDWDAGDDELDEGEEDVVEQLMERDRRRGFVVDFSDEGDDPLNEGDVGDSEGDTNDKDQDADDDTAEGGDNANDQGEVGEHKADEASVMRDGIASLADAHNHLSAAQQIYQQLLGNDGGGDDAYIADNAEGDAVVLAVAEANDHLSAAIGIHNSVSQIVTRGAQRDQAS